MKCSKCDASRARFDFGRERQLSLFRIWPFGAKRFAFALTALLSGLLFGFVQPLHAGQSDFRSGIYSDSAFSTLADFAKEIGLDASSSTESVNRAIDKDKNTESGVAYSELFNFVNQLPRQERDLIEIAAKPAAASKASKSVDPAEATYVGSKACLGCHASQAEKFGFTLMGKLQKQGKLQCETCHGPGSAHAKAGGGRGVGGIISFRPDDKSRTAKENNAICLGCHDKGNRSLWQGSTHETRDISCSNCHTIMRNVSRKSQLKTAFQPDTCFQCHKNKRSEMWRSAHMPVREGKIACTNCHNPHGSFSEALLKQATVNDNCYQCHAEKRGPFLWEHAPVRENCLNCHDPHGSQNEFMLKISRPRLCQQCHSGGSHPSNPRNPFSTFAINRECQNCHSQHHGSNSPSGPRFQR